MPEPIHVSAGVVVPANALSRFARSAPPTRSQNVNKVASKVELRVDLSLIEGSRPTRVGYSSNSRLARARPLVRSWSQASAPVTSAATGGRPREGPRPRNTCPRGAASATAHVSDARGAGGTAG